MTRKENKHGKKMKIVRNKQKQPSRAQTPSSQNHSSQNIDHWMMVSNSAKHQISIKNELYKEESKEYLYKEIQKLNQKINKLEKGNQYLQNENKRYKSIYIENKIPVEQNPIQSHYKPSCEKMNFRDSSRANMHYLNNFNQTDKFNDFGHSYSFENKNFSKVVQTPIPETDFKSSQNNYMTIPASIQEKENFNRNMNIDKFMPKINQKESALMQKVNRIHSKNEIIARMNKTSFKNF